MLQCVIILRCASGAPTCRLQTAKDRRPYDTFGWQPQWHTIASMFPRLLVSFVSLFAIAGSGPFCAMPFRSFAVPSLILFFRILSSSFRAFLCDGFQPAFPCHSVPYHLSCLSVPFRAISLNSFSERLEPESQRIQGDRIFIRPFHDSELRRPYWKLDF